MKRAIQHHTQHKKARHQSGRGTQPHTTVATTAGVSFGLSQEQSEGVGVTVRQWQADHRGDKETLAFAFHLQPGQPVMDSAVAAIR